MRILGVAAAIGTLVACNDMPPPGEALRGAPFEVDPRFGEPLDLGLSALRGGNVSYYGKNGASVLGMYLFQGPDDRMQVQDAEFRLWTWDNADPTRVDEIDPPELVADRFDLWHALTPGEALLAEYGDIPVLYAWDGRDWTFVDPPPGIAFDSAIFVMASPDRMLASGGGVVAAWDGQFWVTVPATAGSVLGPVSEAGFRTVSSGPCTQMWAWGAVSSGEPVCAASGLAPTGHAMAGTVDDFVFNGGGAYLRFHDDAWEPIVGASTYAPGFLLTTAPGRGAFTAVDSVLDGVFAVDSAGEAPLCPASDLKVACGCDRTTDPTCDCVQADLAYVEQAVEFDLAHQGVLSFIDRGAERAVWYRRLELPMAAVPMSAEDTGP